MAAQGRLPVNVALKVAGGILPNRDMKSHRHQVKERCDPQSMLALQ